MNSIIAALLAVVIPPVAAFIAKEIALANGYISGESMLVQGIVGVVVGYLTSLLAHAIGISLPGTLSGLDQNVVASILSGIVALLTHTSAKLALGRAK